MCDSVPVAPEGMGTANTCSAGCRVQDALGAHLQPCPGLPVAPSSDRRGRQGPIGVSQGRRPRRGEVPGGHL